MNQQIRQAHLFLICCVATGAMLVSPAMAQVNGPGPSPSNLFDTVLNLPGDEDIITGAGFESIGGVFGETTQLNVNEGAFVGDGFATGAGAELNISGGSVGGFFFANAGSELNISGGAFGHFFNAQPGSHVELTGGEFQLNGADFTDDNISLAVGDVFTGTLADGSSFVFSSFLQFPVSNDSSLSGDLLNDVTLNIVNLPPLDSDPIVLNSPLSSGPSGLRAGQELTVAVGGSLVRNFALIDATLNVEAGTVGGDAEACNSLVNISGGTVGALFSAYSGTIVNISGGFVGLGFDAHSGSVVNISGGTVSGLFDAYSGTIVNIGGGFVGRGFDAHSGSVVNISGGAVGSLFEAYPGSSVNIRGNSFSINNTPLNNLPFGQPVTITDRNVAISGILTDGEPFSFDLNTAVSDTEDFFSPTATLTITLEAPFLLGDCNQDGVVNFQDISSFITILSSASFLDQADCNQDDVVNFLDIQPFIQQLGLQ